MRIMALEIIGAKRKQAKSCQCSPKFRWEKWIALNNWQETEKGPGVDNVISNILQTKDNLQAGSTTTLGRRTFLPRSKVNIKEIVLYKVGGSLN